MSVEEKRLEKILNQVAAVHGLKEWSFKISASIDSYAGFLVPVSLIGVSDDKEIVQHVYVKLPSLDATVRSFSNHWWDAEGYVYGTLVPLWKRLCNIEIDEIIPKCYFVDRTPENQVLVLKDMRYEGFYKYEDRFLDFDHIMVSLRVLAQFHAFSIIMKQNKVKLDAYPLRPYTTTFPDDLNFALTNSFRNRSQLFKGTKYEEFFKDTLQKYDNHLSDSTEKVKCLVYGHGDFWKDNIMYKYENNKPVKACIFDFQCCRVLSPAREFLNFVFNSTNSNQRRLHYNIFLTTYFSNLKSNLLDNGIELEKFYNMNDFVSDLKIVAPITLFHVSMSFSLWMGFETEAKIKSKNVWESETQRQNDLQSLKEIIENAIQDLNSYGYITL